MSIPTKFGEGDTEMNEKEILDFLKMNVFEKIKLKEKDPVRYEQLLKAANEMFPLGE